MTNPEIFRSDISDSIPVAEKPPGPWPWYVLLLIGYSVSGLFPWLMLARGLYTRNRKMASGLILLINLAIFFASGWFMLTAKVAWWWLVIIAYAFNLAWTLAAVVFQKFAIGAADRRYFIKDWKQWIKPLTIALLIGFCVGTIFSTVPAFENRIPQQQTMDSLDRQTVLWDFFSYSHIGLLASLLVGLWWAGEGKRFRTGHVIVFLGGFILTFLCWGLLWMLMALLLHKGTVSDFFLLDQSRWAMVPPWRSGLQNLLGTLEEYNLLPLIIVPLLLGNPARVRTFGKRALLIPLLFVFNLPLNFTSDSWWLTVQDQIMYEMNSADTGSRASAHRWADILLARYPDHLQWPRIAEKSAQIHYQNERFEQSRQIYRDLIDKYQDSGQWHWVIQRSRTALNSPEFGRLQSSPQLTIPMVDYQSYLTHNWMALLSVMRYWEGSAVPESKVVIKLKDLSKSPDKIKLNPLVNLAELDDASRSMGYEMLLFPSDVDRIQVLIEAGIPVIHQRFKSFDVVFGADNSRSLIKAYSFSRLSRRLRNEKPKDAEEIVDIKQEGQGNSRKRLVRIAHESYQEYSSGYWQKPSLQFMGPFSAVVFPPEKTEVVSRAFGMPNHQLREVSNGYLATLIALSCLDHGDPIQAIEWSKISAAKIQDPLPMYIAHLAEIWWNSRNKIVQSSLNLQNQLPELDRVFNFLNLSANRRFLDDAQQRFEQGFAQKILPWMICRRYFDLLDPSAKPELDRRLQILETITAYDPTIASDWILLADSYDWAGDTPGTISALKGAVSADPLNSKAKLLLAKAYLAGEHYEKAKGVLARIDAAKVKFNADYPFCLAVLAEWEGRPDKALSYYAAAIEMRRYRPIYHLRYGKLLISQGMAKKAKPYLEWAARIDTGESLKNEAVNLLAKIND